MGTLWVAGNDMTASLLNQYYGFADTTFTTVTAATQTQLSTSYSIAANEPSAGSAYTVDFGGNGTWGATQQTLVFGLSIGGVALLASVTIGAQAFSASAAFRFAGVARFAWNQVGASGNVLADIMGNLTQTANNVAPPGTYTQGNFQSANSIGFADANTAASATINSTVSTAVFVTCAWGSTTGAPTLTNRKTIFRKVA